MARETHEYDLLDKSDLRALSDRLPKDDARAVEQCIAFFEAETFGPWHGRARAMMSRRLKHCRIDNSQRESNGIGSQAGSWGVEAALRFSGLSIWFIRITSLRITATSATFGFLPAARSRW